jgi:hypothetical protein
MNPNVLGTAALHLCTADEIERISQMRFLRDETASMLK